MPLPQMGRLRAVALATAALLAAILSPRLAIAHVGLDSPNGGDGQTLVGGELFTIQWHPEVEHETVDWDLWYTTDDPEQNSEPNWISIAENLPLGDPQASAIHTYDWLVPNQNLAEAWVRVRQDNELPDEEAQDYYDWSDASFRIVASTLAGDYNGDGLVSAADYAVWREALNSGASPADGTGDNQTDHADYLLWSENFGGAQPATLSLAAPEPATVGMIAAVGLCALFRQGRRSSEA